MKDTEPQSAGEHTAWNAQERPCQVPKSFDKCQADDTGSNA
jgi:hypothetical protein